MCRRPNKMAADIIKLDLTDVEDATQGNYQVPFELTSNADDANIILAAGRVEYLGEFPYRVEGGDLTVTDNTGATGIRYIHIKEDGDGTASAYVDTNAGTYDPNKGGFYHTDGALVLYQMIKSAGPIYSRKARRWPNDPGGEIEKARQGSVDLDERITAWTLAFS